MDKNEALTSARLYAVKVAPVLRPEQIILYGSFASGTAHEDSDIDVAVVVKKLTGDYLDTARMLYKLRRDVDDRIEPLLLEEAHDRSGFLAQIRRTGVMIFERV